jgi:Rps23 Pro-64 3,4-dihydroxylase Tpa1-like proline 4-hydroxylase
MAELLLGFLTPDEVSALRARQHDDSWKPGRQGTGYDILPLPRARDGAIERALARIGTPYEDYWDVYLIRYRDGSHIPPHTDEAQHGRRHRRLNALLERATAGGELTIAGARFELTIGDAVLFEPDREVHEVARVVGSRLLFSVGAWV